MARGDPVEGENVAVCGRHPVLLGGVTEGPDYVGLQVGGEGFLVRIGCTHTSHVDLLMEMLLFKIIPVINEGKILRLMKNKI